MRRLMLIAGLMTGCDDCSGQHMHTVDAPMMADDATVDVLSIDAPGIDAPPPTIEAECGSPSPACTTTPTVLYPTVDGTFLSSMAQIGPTLYVATYDTVNGQAAGARVTVIDLTTGTIVGKLFDGTDVMLSKSLGWIYAAESGTSGTLWRFRPGVAPTPLVTGRPFLGAATADADFVYWAEDLNTGGRVMRMPLQGGSPEQVMSCPQAWRIRLDDTFVYCEEFGQHLVRAPKTGTTMTTELLHPTYVLVGLAQCDSTLYATVLGDQLVYTIPTPDGPGTVTTTISSPTPLRVTGLSASAGHVYVTTGSGIYRVDRTTNAYTKITTGYPEDDSLVWNGQLFFFARGVGVSRCVD